MKFQEISDAFWEAVEPLIPQKKRESDHEYQRESGGGRKPLDYRKVLEAILYVLKTGTQWKSLPKEIFGSPSSIHAYFKKWEAQGFFRKLWEKGLVEFEEMKGIAWEWTREKAKAGSELAKKTASKLTDPEDGLLSWRPVIPRRNREQAQEICNKVTSLFTDKFKS